jgi:endonuclease/exonuclease/phosphatase family metal-dependent hydrolase
MIIVAALAAVGGIFAVASTGRSGLVEAQPATAPASAPAKPAAPAAPAPGTPATGAPAAKPALPPTEVSMRFGRAEPIKRTPGTIRVMSYNVENLFDAKDDPTLTGKADDKDMTKPAEHSKAAADAIKRCDPDVIALQEIESLEALTEFRDTYLSGLGYDHIVSIDTGDGRGIENSVISRFPLKNVETWKNLPLGGTHPDLFENRPNEFAGQPLTFKRSPLRVTVEVPASKVAELAGASAPAKPYELTLFVVHQKSGRGGDYWRQAESRKTVELAAELTKKNPVANILILGDFNARSREEPLKIYTRAGLRELWGDPDADRDRTAITHASNRRIDHIIFNDSVSGEIVRDSKFVLAMPTRPEGVDFRTTAPPKGYASDHFPVVLDVRVVDQPPVIDPKPDAKPASPSAPAAPAAPANRP